ncbi:hypothetical protein G647_09081 [Cladophialophora carrionii CBS 160.54]|uniref:Uncharacterized protein n=1 Tax=Cladophialophora carrionii CBS 160.54 TaxID=1279043 RepID=V9CX81_9EURO|nr:uncharacterized protein G647_09081 [Cladophialophora carrionii CBS 160.54]ETI19249.1 hypothetical protein G647_09081 [Cladophialophora carrionii CBS 160.54]
MTSQGHAIKAIAMEYATILAREYADDSNDAAIFTHCLAIARGEVKKLANFARNRERAPSMTSTTKIGTTTFTVTYLFDGHDVEAELIDNPLKQKL